MECSITKLAVGILIPNRKLKKLNIENIVDKNYIELHVFNGDSDELESNLNKVRFLLHKANDISIERFSNKEEAGKYVEHVVSLCQRFNVKMIDDLGGIRILENRVETMKYAESTLNEYKKTMNLIEIHIPHYLFVDEKPMDSSFLTNKLIANNIKPPFLVKPISGQSSNERYDMSIHFHLNSEKLMNELPNGRFLIQNFIDHDGIIYKIYTIGSKWRIVKRPSIKNLSDYNTTDPVYFKSNSISKKHSISFLHSPENQNINKNIHTESIDALVKCLLNVFGINLCGIDIIIDKFNHYHIVDINYFPGYDGVDDFGTLLTDFFMEFPKK